MDHDAIARAGRRREVLDALEFERDREAALLRQIETVVLEEEGPRIDRAARTLLSPSELDLLGNVLGEPLEPEEEDEVDNAGEIERLQGEVERSRQRQQALAHLSTLLASPLPEVTQPEAAL